MSTHAKATTARWLKYFLLGIFTGLLGAIVHLSPAGLWLEEKFGLYWLFHLRGAVTAPDNVMAIDQPSATQLGLPITPRLWPRDLHAQVIEQLTQAGVRIIVFDHIFDTPGALATHEEELAHNNRVRLDRFSCRMLYYRMVHCATLNDNLPAYASSTAAEFTSYHRYSA